MEQDFGNWFGKKPCIIYSEAKESVHFWMSVFYFFHCSGVKFCMIYFYSRQINRIYDGVEVETRKSQASFQII